MTTLPQPVADHLGTIHRIDVDTNGQLRCLSCLDHLNAWIPPGTELNPRDRLHLGDKTYEVWRSHAAGAGLFLMAETGVLAPDPVDHDARRAPRPVGLAEWGFDVPETPTDDEDRRAMREQLDRYPLIKALTSTDGSFTAAPLTEWPAITYAALYDAPVHQPDRRFRVRTPRIPMRRCLRGVLIVWAVAVTAMLLLSCTADDDPQMTAADITLIDMAAAWRQIDQAQRTEVCDLVATDGAAAVAARLVNAVTLAHPDVDVDAVATFLHVTCTS